ncbi:MULTISPECIES: pili length/flagellar attachment protein FleP [Pseudomonas aeruginosa group]|uniref:pili length/flagellar attachment protein FleP n=1 Tax=Pseudomonas aeruginosa group TaxID=136841 RepID=UPI0006B26FE4|nr:MULTISPECIES: pili length/flagellar attachment protein FleP [Pseudomonas aeruginosa group]VTS64686.1 Uncharacterised protein [Streptococcus dysgalactiae subsp. equisimilis]AVR69014.1 flagellar protein FliT [Pseudomonas paraeruginosa]KRU87742.1 flagellar assembly protein FliT [Pseudomonas aeruginosa]KSF73412.1 flagellar protein FliT [Pseudomonas aeruginosa]KSP93995.1 flagellar protein FliT [Pseudomonas aeruginosa]
MSQATQQLDETRLALADALQAGNWEAIGELDQVCQVKIDEAMHEAERDEQALRTTLEQLLSLYNDMLGACQRQREAIGAELTGLQRASKGAKVYQMFG